MAVATTWRPVYTASRWSTLLDGMRATMTERAPGAPGPPLTNAEAVAFIREWRDVSHASSSLWWQFAAVAYGWSPTSDALNTGAQQAGRWYAPTLAPDLWRWAEGIASELDARADGQPPRIAVDKDTFADPVFFGNVRARLVEDGARATFKIPSGFCVDKSGRKRTPQAPCDKRGRGPLVGFKNGKPIYAPCDKPGDCSPEFFDDPITVAVDRVSTLLLVVGAVWLFTRPTRRSRRRN